MLLPINVSNSNCHDLDRSLRVNRVACPPVKRQSGNLVWVVLL